MTEDIDNVKTKSIDFTKKILKINSESVPHFEIRENTINNIENAISDLSHYRRQIELITNEIENLPTEFNSMADKPNLLREEADMRDAIYNITLPFMEYMQHSGLQHIIGLASTLNQDTIMLYNYQEGIEEVAYFNSKPMVFTIKTIEMMINKMQDRDKYDIFMDEARQNNQRIYELEEQEAKELQDLMDAADAEREEQ